MNAAIRLALLAALVLLALPRGTAHAGGPSGDVLQAEIRPGWITERGTRMAALHLTLAPGWKTYWRAPGEAGIPPSFDWSGSKNLKSVAYHWPSPQVFESYGLRSVGYIGELVLPIELFPHEKGAPIALRGEVALGICETICMPARLEFDADLAGAGLSDPTIQAALASQPRSAKRAGVRGVHCNLAPIRDGLRLEAEIDMPRLAGEEFAMVEAGDPRIWVSEPMVRRTAGGLGVTADLVPPAGQPMALDRSELRFTVIAGQDAVDIRGCAAN
ncbi:hypothetical protein EU800_12370 [Tropicimonas sp. IMCC6043]|nr:hypothetical protein EU800_12370 [Tropicimonas sp. IMCC6043]